MAGRDSPSARTIPRGHKVALRAIRAGEPVIKYGSPIGVGDGGHPAGDARAHAQRGERARPRRPAAARSRRPTRRGWPSLPTIGESVTAAPRPTFQGYRRPDGRVGVRNHLLVVPTVICSSVVAERVAAAVAPIGTALPHTAGCGQLGPDMHAHARDAGGLLRPSERRRRAGHRARLRAGRRAAPRRRRAQRRQAGAGRSRSRARAAPCGRPSAASRSRGSWRRARAGRRARPATSRSLILCGEVRRIRLHVGLASNPALGRVADRLVDSRRRRGARRDRRDHGRRASAGRARAEPRHGGAAAARHQSRRNRSDGARPRHPRHAAVARQHPRRPDDDRREVARRDAQGRRAHAARRRRRLLRADHAARG